jgi:hypothetical protein
MAAGECAKYGNESDGRGAIVQKTFRFDQYPQASMNLGLLEGRDDRDRIGRGDQHSKDDGAAPIPSQCVVHPECSDRGCQRNAHCREQRDNGQLFFEFSPVDEKRRLEHQGRQKDRKYQVP